MKRAFRFAVLTVAMCAVFTAARAQSDVNPVGWHIFGGWVPVAGEADTLVDDGWDLGFGATWRLNPAASPWAVKFDGYFAGWDAKSKVTNTYRVDDGDAESWAITAAFVYESKNPGKVGWYAGAGVGGYHLEAQLTEDVLVPGLVCDFWGYCYYVTTVGEVTIADTSTTKFGYHAQAGIRLKFDNGTEMAFETRYEWVQTKKTFEYYPLNIAFRF